MALFGEDFRGGWFRRLHQPVNPAGLWWALGFAVILVVVYQASLAVLAGLLAAVWFAGEDGMRSVLKASLVAILPAALLTSSAAAGLAGLRGGHFREVLSLRSPRLGAAGWALLLVGFLVAMYAAIVAIMLALGLDMTQYTPGPDGKPPDTGSTGLVKEAMFDIANEPRLFLLVLPSVVVGAPLAEELIFRGQLFSALARTPLGYSGTSIVTALLWALLHMTETWLSIGMIFVMGLMFGWMMYRFGSLWVTIVCHAVWNGLFALATFGASQT